jgi:nondiscriminating aspartyl-tRNA synthetase
MERTLIQQVKDNIGQEVLIKGFVHTIRNQGSIKFLIIRDVTASIQVVVLKSASEAFEVVDEVTCESVVEITGLSKEEKQAPTGYEIEARTIKILSKSAPELPIPVVTEKGSEEVDITKRLDWRWLDLRKEDGLKIFKVWTSLEKGFRKHFDDAGYVQVYTPSFMSSPSESGSEVFEVEYFDRKAYLAQSPQFYKQMGMAAGFEKVFMFGPVFRAEPSFTTRHMTEFTGWDFEISYIDSHYDVMEEEERLIVAGFTQVKQDLGIDLEIPAIPFPKVTMKEAKEKLAKIGIKSEKEHDLSPEEERELTKIIKEEQNHDFVFITDYHISVRPFYHMRVEGDPTTTKSFDLLYKGLEITTGAQREHRVDVLQKQAEEKGMSLNLLENYINFFRYGCPPHGGVGIGPGRLVMRMLEVPSVKEVTFLPRDVKRLTP